MFEKKKEERKDANVEIKEPVNVNSKVGDVKEEKPVEEKEDQPSTGNNFGEDARIEEKEATDTQSPPEKDPDTAEEKKEEPKEKPWVGNHRAGN